MNLVAFLEAQVSNLKILDTFEEAVDRSAGEMVKWLKAEERKMAEVGDVLFRYIDELYKKYRGPTIERLMVHKIGCRILEKMLVELDDDFLVLRALYQLHKRTCKDPSQLDPKSPAWSEQLEGPEQKLFLDILGRRKLPENIAEVFLNSDVQEGAISRGLFLATHLEPSRVVAKLVGIKEDTAIEMIRQFPDEPRCRIFTLLLKENTACSLMIAARIATKLYVTTVSQMVDQLKSFANEPDTQEAVKWLYKAQWVLDPQRDPSQCQGLSEKLGALAKECELKRYPELRWSQKIKAMT